MGRVVPLLVISAVMAAAQTPGDVLDLFRRVSEALSEKNSSSFFDKFDSKMPQYETLRLEVEPLLASDAQIGSSIDIASDQGDDQKRSLELDWVLEISDREPKRAIVKCQIERQGTKWKITALDPVEFFAQ